MSGQRPSSLTPCPAQTVPFTVSQSLSKYIIHSFCHSLSVRRLSVPLNGLRSLRRPLLAVHRLFSPLLFPELLDRVFEKLLAIRHHLCPEHVEPLAEVLLLVLAQFAL